MWLTDGLLTNGIRCIKLKQRWKVIRLKRVIDWRTSDQWDTLYQIKTKMKGHKIKTCDWLTDFWPMGYTLYQIKTKMKGHKIKTCDWRTSDQWDTLYQIKTKIGLVWFYFRINQHLKEHSKIYVKEIRLVAHFSCNYNCYCCSSMGPVTIT